jgi:hypothetical protein
MAMNRARKITNKRKIKHGKRPASIMGQGTNITGLPTEENLAREAESQKHRTGKVLSGDNRIVLGPDLIVNGQFVNNEDWSNSGTWTIGGGTAQHQFTSASHIWQTVPILTIGKTYQLHWTQANMGSTWFRIYDDLAVTEILAETFGETTNELEFVAAGTATVFRTNANGGALSNVSCFELLSEWTP